MSVKNTFYLRKRIIYISVLGIALAGILFLFLPYVFASNSNGVGQQTMDLFDTLITQGPVAIFGIGNGDFAEDFIGMTNKALDITMAVGLLWVIGITFFTIIKEFATNANISIDTWIKAILKIIVGFALILYCIPIMDALDNAGNKILNFVCNSNLSSQNAQTISQNLLGFVYAGFIVTFVMAYLYIAYFGYLFEFLLRRIFMPIAIGNIVTEGLRSPGYRFIKRYLTVYIKIAAMIMVIAIAVDFAATQTNPITILVILLATTGCLGKITKIVDEAMGNS